jgi:large subunit ribosomal protein L4
MPKIAVKNLAGENVEEFELDGRLFDLPMNAALLHQVFMVLTGNLRTAIAHTKDRSERAGSGKKPWRQKGTGRARAGSVRSPIWRKGGVTFGPTKDRNFRRALTQKMRQKAVLIALSEKLRQGKLVVVDSFEPAVPKTKAFATALAKLSVSPRTVAVSLTTSEQSGARFMRNIPTVDLVHHPDLNAAHLLRSEFILMSKTALQDLDSRFKQWKR